MLLALVLAVDPAAAYTLAPCPEGFVVTDTVPSPGAVDVPTDLRIALVYAPGGCDPNDWTAELVDGDGAHVSLQDDPDPEGSYAQTALEELFPLDPLAADTPHTLTLTSHAGAASEIGFSTGTGTVAGLVGAPTVNADGATWTPPGRARPGVVTLELTVHPADDPDGLSVIQVQDAHTERALRAFRVGEEGAMAVSTTWQAGTRPAEVCPQVRQIDGAGRATEWSEPACATTSGCSAVGTGGLGVLGVLLAAALGVRRRA